MDKEQKKKLSQKYKKKELEKELHSGNSILENWAKLKLGKTSEPLTINEILRTPDEELIELVYHKIQEFAEIKYRDNPKLYKSSEKAIYTLPELIQQFYFSYEFEMQLEIGDFNKFLADSTIKEIQIIAEFYQLIGFTDFAFKILNAANGDEDIYGVELDFEFIKIKIQERKIDIIRQNAGHFLLN